MTKPCKEGRSCFPKKTMVGTHRMRDSYRGDYQKARLVKVLHEMRALIVKMYPNLK